MISPDEMLSVVHRHICRATLPETMPCKSHPDVEMHRTKPSVLWSQGSSGYVFLSNSQRLVHHVWQTGKKCLPHLLVKAWRLYLKWGQCRESWTGVDQDSEKRWTGIIKLSVACNRSLPFGLELLALNVTCLGEENKTCSLCRKSKAF